MRPLDGITVLDLSRLLPSGAATMLLANFGADGDYGR
jgi:crotonobetainyl-CoA:carnitine CoA-transferase CaiB-like acyl-CoA transferase